MKKTLEIGKIIGAHGIKGEIILFPITDEPERLKELEYFLIDGTRYAVSSVRFHKGNALVSSPDVADRTAAEKLKGRFVSLYRQDATPLSEGEYYIQDLVGLDIIDKQRVRRGKITDIIQNKTSADIIEYELEGETYLMAFTKENVTLVDIKGGFLEADFGAGLKT